MAKKKKILYLDQFAVSNMYNSNPTPHWGKLRSVIIEKVDKGLLSCPMPLEHLYETVGRSNKDEDGNVKDEYDKEIIKQHDFFSELANGKAFFGYEMIAANEIIMLLRQGKVSPMKSIYIHEAYYPHINISEIYDEGHSFNEEYHNEFQALFQAVNELRNETKSSNDNIRGKNIDVFQKAIISLQVDKYLARLKELQQKGYIILQGVRCGSLDMPNKVDCLIEILLKRKKIKKEEIGKLIREFEKNGFDRIPSMNIRSILSADIAINDRQQSPNDEIDLDRAAIGLRISDFFFADNERKLIIEKYKLNERYHTKVYSGKKDSVNAFIQELSKL